LSARFRMAFLKGKTHVREVLDGLLGKVKPLSARSSMAFWER
jgi:hypothetical protein